MAKKRKEPKKGTGKHPGKKYGRRLYTDENPRDTVGIKPFARKIQILTVGEQRAKVMGKSEVASIFKKGKEAIRNRRKA